MFDNSTVLAKCFKTCLQRFTAKRTVSFLAFVQMRRKALNAVLTNSTRNTVNKGDDDSIDINYSDNGGAAADGDDDDDDNKDTND